MMYSNKMVVVVKVGGRVLREKDDSVFLPFGCEYSLLFKNLNTVRAQIKATIDGNEMIPGSSLVVGPNSSVEVERFVVNNAAGNRFKFIERTAQIEQHRGVGAEDGLIRVEFQYEKVVQPLSYPSPYITPKSRGGTLRGMSLGAPYGGEFYGSVAASSSGIPDASFNSAGITVPGSVSHQKFQTVEGFPLEPEAYVLVLRLLGEDPLRGEVQAPVTVKTRLHCPTCGTASEFLSKFCKQCGTSLETVSA